MAEDHDRPLTARGRKAAQGLAEHFHRAAIRPQLVLCSSAVRARQTLAPISDALRLEDRTRIESGLYGAPAERLLARLRTVQEQVPSVLMIAHNPGLQELALELAGDDPEMNMKLREKFPTGALAEVVSDCARWSDLGPERAQVVSLTVPRHLPQ